MTMQKKLQDILGGALGLVGMIETLLHGDDEGAAAAGPPAKRKGTVSKKPVAKGKTGEAKAKPSAVTKKSVKKPVVAKKSTPPPIAAKKGTAAPAKQVKQAAASALVKGDKKG